MGKHSAPKKSVLASIPLPAARVIGGTAAAVGLPLSLIPSGASATTAIGPDKNSTEPALPALLTNSMFAAPTFDELARLRMCEASGHYQTNTGNGFYGAYQFDASTWRGLGLPGLPHQASAPLQDRAAGVLEQLRGWEPWPSCSRQLGLIPRRNHALTASQIVAGYAPVAVHRTASGATAAVAAPAAVAAVAAAPAPVQVHSAPAFSGKVLSTVDSQRYRADVRLWQERMVQRGWQLSVDGYFGAQSAGVARSFAAEKGIREGFPGEVGAKVWSAAWRLPVA